MRRYLYFVSYPLLDKMQVFTGQIEYICNQIRKTLSQGEVLKVHG